jgi:beta-glucosidase
MTSYNKLNGTHCNENRWLLDTLLRKEWKHEGLVMSDWYGTYSVSESINAGANLEMPGPARWRSQELVGHLINAHKIDKRQIDKLATELLKWVQDLTKLNESLVYAPPKKEETRNEQAKDAKLIRKVGTEGMVLLKNDDAVLPLGGKKKIAVIGPNAKAKVLTGGGSAQLRSAWSQTPWDGLVANKPKDVELDYSLGAFTAKFLPIFGEDFTCLDGTPGFDLNHYAVVDGKQAAQPTVVDKFDVSDMFMADFYHPDLGSEWYSEVKALFTAPIDGEYEFGLAVTGQAWLWVDDKLVVDNSRNQKKGSSYFGNGTEEVKGTIKVEKGKKYTVRVLHDSRSPPDEASGETTPFNITGCRIGAFPVYHPDQAIEDAVALAKSSDVAVIIAGLNADWESEGYDRPNLSLPLRSDELIARVAEANPDTVVVIQAGSAVSMPWVDKVKGVVQAWYGGNETGNAIADIVYGHVNPSGRLPVTFPKREVDIAANLNYKSARTKIYYEEGIWVGYKHHNARGIAPLFPFGHGLSYTTFDYSDLKISGPTGSTADDWNLKASVKVTNTGKVAGSHSVHFYTCPPEESSTSLTHPSHTLQAFAKVKDLAPGKSKTVEVTLDKYAISHWDEGYQTWRAELGEWAVKIGVDAQTLWGEAKFSIDKELEWNGL